MAVDVGLGAGDAADDHSTTGTWYFNVAVEKLVA
jgi:hypothetical protein